MTTSLLKTCKAERPNLIVDGEIFPIVGYSPVSGANQPLFEKQTSRFFGGEFNCYFLTLPPSTAEVGDFFATPLWAGDDISATAITPSTMSFDAMARHILAGDPDARFWIRCMATEPASWRSLHPGDVFINEVGQTIDCPSLASDAYTSALEKFSSALVAHCESHEWSDRILGYWNGLSHEGTPISIINHWLFDHSPVMEKRWREFLHERYQTDTNLRNAHADSSLCLETISVPRDRLRYPTAEVSAALYWQEANKNQPLRDYLELIGRCFQESTGRLATAMRAAAGPNRVLIYDMLKMPMLGWSNPGFFEDSFSWPLAFPDTLAGSGHLNIAPLLDHPGVDGLITPHDYQARGIGGVYEPEGAADSIVLRGKLFLCEMDTRTFMGSNPTSPAQSPEEFSAITWRNLASGWTRGYQSYWMDVYEDWFADNELHAIIKRQATVCAEAARWPHETPRGIAVVLDDKAVLETNGAGNFFNEAIFWEAKMGLARCGVPFRFYLFEDLERENFPGHGVFYFPNLFHADAGRRQVLKEKVFCSGNVVVWGPGSGISDGKKLGTTSASSLTGFEFDWLGVNHPRRTLITNFEHPATRGCAPDTVIGGSLAYGPCLYPRDGISLGLAWTKQGRNWCGLAAKNFGQGPGEIGGAGDYGAVFTTGVPLPASLWRGISQWAGVHIYEDSGQQILASRHVLAVHATRGTLTRIKLPEPARVTDIITGDVVGENLLDFSLNITAPETRVFRLEPV